MNWEPVARKDFLDAVRSRLLIGLTALFVLVVVGGAGLFISVADTSGSYTGGEATGFIINQFLFAFGIPFLPSPVGTVVPIAALAVSYRALAGERDTGSIKLLLSLPHTRADAVVGKFLGRSAVVALAVGVAFVIGGLVTLVSLRAIGPLSYLLFVLLTVLYGAAVVSLGVAVSAATGSSSRAALGVLGVYVVFDALWGLVNDALVWVATGTFPLFQQSPAWSEFLRGLAPTDAYFAAVRATMAAVLPQSVAEALGYVQPPGTPLYLRNEWGLLVLVLWIAVPLGLAYLRFRDVDL